MVLGSHFSSPSALPGAPVIIQNQTSPAKSNAYAFRCAETSPISKGGGALFENGQESFCLERVFLLGSIPSRINTVFTNPFLIDCIVKIILQLNCFFYTFKSMLLVSFSKKPNKSSSPAPPLARPRESNQMKKKRDAVESLSSTNCH